MVSDRAAALVAVSFFLGLPATFMLAVRGLPPRPAWWGPAQASGLHLAGLATTSENAASSTIAPAAAQILLAQISKLRDSSRPSNFHQINAKLAAMHLSVGKVYCDAGLSEDAMHHYKLSQELAGRVEDDAQLVAARAAAGQLHLELGRFREAQKELDVAHRLTRRLDREGQGDKETAFRIAWMLANARQASGLVTEALELYAEAEMLVNTVSPAPAEDDFAGLLSDSGETHRNRGQVAKAIDYQRKALAHLGTVRRNRGSKTHKDLTAAVHHRLGQALHDSGRVVMALEQYQKALGASEDVKTTIAALLSRAQAEKASPEGVGIDAALRTVEQAETLLLGQEDSASVVFGRVLAQKADLLRESSRFAEAELCAHRALEAMQKALGAEMPEIAVTLNGLGSIYHGQGRYHDAIQEFLQALTINLKTVGFFHPETAASYQHLGNIYQSAGDAGTARRYYQRCLDVQKRCLAEAPECITRMTCGEAP